MKTTNDLVIVGGGVAGMVAAYEALCSGWKVLVIDRHPVHLKGGLARTAFGGMALVGTQEQKIMRVPDSQALMLSDWLSFAELDKQDHWPYQWAEHYVEHCRSDVYEWLKSLGLRFLPAVNWVERGRFAPGNSVPRYHVLWGTGLGLVQTLERLLDEFVRLGRLTWQAGTQVTHLNKEESAWVLACRNEQSGMESQCFAHQLIISCGGFTGNLDRVRQEWAGAPLQMLNGSHPYCDGVMHDAVVKVGGRLTHMQSMWNYAAGIRHPSPGFEGHGLSLIPPKSALWLNHKGERIGPEPLVAGFDTTWLCQRVAEQERPWTWQLLNKRIAVRELAVSGAEHNPHIRDHRWLPFAKDILLGNSSLYEELTQKCPDVVVAEDVGSLVEKMNQLTEEPYLSASSLRHAVEQYDAQIQRGSMFWDDDQLRRIEQLRQWRSERLRTCRPRPILSPSSGPLMAMRLRLITRKSLGGIQTDLSSRVLDVNGVPIAGLYAIGEAAGFGGGGSSGRRSLEGTFLSGCILTAKQAVRSLGNSQ